jgi:hypothetical protein
VVVKAALGDVQAASHITQNSKSIVDRRRIKDPFPVK